MKELRVSWMGNDEFETFIINDITNFLEHLKADPKISTKYKTMNEHEFREWVEQGISAKQFNKLKKLNDL